MAEKLDSDFGLATECGFSRHPPATVRDPLRLDKELTGSGAVWAGGRRIAPATRGRLARQVRLRS